MVLEVDLGDDAFEDPPLLIMSVLNIGARLRWRIGGLTCQTKGKFLRFAAAKARARTRSMLTGMGNLPVTSSSRWRREGMVAIAARKAPKLKVPPMKGRRDTADMTTEGKKRRTERWKTCLTARKE
jgi:hypothetical protein